MTLKVDHIGYAVRDTEAAKQLFAALGYNFPNPTITDTDRNVYLTFGYSSGQEYCVELIAPIDDSGSPVDKILKKIGSTPYHLCYKSTAFEDDIAHLEEEGFMVAVPPARAVAFGGKRVVFLFSRAIGWVELVEQ